MKGASFVSLDQDYDDTWPLLLYGKASGWPLAAQTKEQWRESYGDQLVTVKRMQNGQISGGVKI